ncbi:MAG: hypothetical protein JHC95_14800 [Solirubrobacteraceae bacterium]|nr:hypothetical protein [Solirubrobacteraceae bacterium]
MNTSPGSFIAAMGAVVYGFAIAISYACTANTVAFVLIAWAGIVVASVLIGRAMLTLLDDEDGEPVAEPVTERAPAPRRQMTSPSAPTAA